MDNYEMEPSDMMMASEKINSVLLNNHINFLVGEINEHSASEIIKWIIYENTINEPDKILTLYINSDGGSLSDALALIDIMRTSNYPIKTVGIGSIISAAFLIFSCGTKGMRVIAKNSSIMCHQYSGNIGGKQHDMQAIIKEIDLTNTRIVNILKDVSNLSVKMVNIKLLPPSDVWMTPEELVECGIADIIS